jgi:homoserine O-acetyltransferase
MTKLTRMVLVLSLLFAAAVSAQDDSQLFAELGDCALANGETLHDCRVGYRTYGQLNADRSNVIVFPTWYTGTAKNLADFGYIGSGRIADTDRFYVIAIDAFGNGVSSSPSNSPSQAGRDFPAVAIRDMVNAQHRLLTGALGLDHIYGVVGVSMGGMQAYQWLVSHPGFMDKVVAIEGTPWPTSYDLLLWGSWLEAENVWAGDEESLAQASKLLAWLDALTLWTPGKFNELVDVDGFDEYMGNFTPLMSGGQLLDRHAQTLAVLGHDIRRGIDGFDQHVGERVQARLLSVVFARDHMVNPGPAQALSLMLGVKPAVMDTPCGHMGATADCEQDAVAEVVNQFLAAGFD